MKKVPIVQAISKTCYSASYEYTSGRLETREKDKIIGTYLPMDLPEFETCGDWEKADLVILIDLTSAVFVGPPVLKCLEATCCRAVGGLWYWAPGSFNEDAFT